jgi:hypothetical protein
MKKYIAFNNSISFKNQEIKIPYKIQELESNLSEVYIDDELYYQVNDNYDFENFKNQYIMVDKIIKEFTKDDAMIFEAQILQNQSLEIIKAEKRKLVDDLYSKALILQIENGFTFQIDLRSKYGDQLLNIIANSIGSYVDEFKSRQVITFFVNIEENNKQKQIYISCYNWIWQYIFEELLFYIKATKQLKESFIAVIENSTSKELKEIQFNFTKENGIKINVSKTIQQLLEIVDDVDPVGNIITIPEFVKEAIRRTNRELFKYAEQEAIKISINEIINKSWFD